MSGLANEEVDMKRTEQFAGINLLLNGQDLFRNAILQPGPPEDFALQTVQEAIKPQPPATVHAILFTDTVQAHCSRLCLRVTVHAKLKSGAELFQLFLCTVLAVCACFCTVSATFLRISEANGVYYIGTDINPHAVRVTHDTLEAHGVHAELITTDIASGLEKRLTGLVDVMVVNPPYVPTPEDEVGREGIASSWAGGENGRRVIDKILPIADKLLSNRGWLYMVTLSANNPSEICLQMRKRGYGSCIVVQRSTEEENLHVIKFWRDFDGQVETNETKIPGVMESLLSQFPQLSFRGHGYGNSSFTVKK